MAPPDVLRVYLEMGMVAMVGLNPTSITNVDSQSVSRDGSVSGKQNLDFFSRLRYTA